MEPRSPTFDLPLDRRQVQRILDLYQERLHHTVDNALDARVELTEAVKHLQTGRDIRLVLDGKRKEVGRVASMANATTDTMVTAICTCVFMP